MKELASIADMGRGKKKPESKKPVSLTEHLSLNSLWKKSIAKDGSCLFRAVAEQARLYFFSPLSSPLVSCINWNLYDPLYVGRAVPGITSRGAPQMRRLHRRAHRPFQRGACVLALVRVVRCVLFACSFSPSLPKSTPMG